MNNRAAEGSSVASSVDRYRRAEQILWDQYRLKPTERFVELEEPAVRLRVVEVGKGEPVMFVPGSGGTGPYWAPLVAELGAFRCLLLDRPGWGLSSPIDFSRYEYDKVTAKVLVGVLDAMGIDQANVVGGSIGNIWALRLAQYDRSRVGRVVLIGGFPYPGWKVHPILKLLRSPLGALIVRLPPKAGMMRKQLRDIGHGPSLDAGRIPDEFFKWRVEFARHTDSMRHERDMVRAILGRHGFKPGVGLERTELATVEPPVLMIYGTADPVGSVPIWNDQLGGLPDSQLSVIDNGGHLSWWDDPKQVGTLVDNFLKP